MNSDRFVKVISLVVTAFVLRKRKGRLELRKAVYSFFLVLYPVILLVLYPVILSML